MSSPSFNNIQTECVHCKLPRDQRDRSQNVYKPAFLYTAEDYGSTSRPLNLSPSNSGNQVKRKRQRIAFTTTQLSLLEEEYKRNPYITGFRRKELAHRLILNDKTVKVWFQNRRMKEKKEDSRPTDDYYDDDQLVIDEDAYINISHTDADDIPENISPQNNDHMNIQKRAEQRNQNSDFEEGNISSENITADHVNISDDEPNDNTIYKKHIPDRNSIGNASLLHHNIHQQSTNSASHNPYMETSKSTMSSEQNLTKNMAKIYNVQEWIKNSPLHTNEKPINVFNNNLAWNPYGLIPMLPTGYHPNIPNSIPSSSYDSRIMFPPAPNISNCNCDCNKILYASYIPPIIRPVSNPNNDPAKPDKEKID